MTSCTLENHPTVSQTEFLSHLLMFLRVVVYTAPNIMRSAGRLNITENPPLIQLLGESPDYWTYRRNLPVFKYRDEILRQLECQQVVVIGGDVGCGKTTQVPQYILENAYEKKQPCRIISIQPRRISVHAAADRVTTERGNKKCNHFYVEA